MPRRLTVAQAAAALGIGETAVRQRIGRRTLATERRDGRVYVLLDDTPADTPETDAPPDTPVSDAAIAALVGVLREERQRASAAEQAAAMHQEHARNLAAEVERLTAQVAELLALPEHAPDPPAWWRRLLRRR